MVPNLPQNTEYRIRRNQGGLSDNIWIGFQGGSNQANFYCAFKKKTILLQRLSTISINFRFTLVLMYKLISIIELYLAFLIYSDILVLFKIFKMVEFIMFPTLQIKNYTSVIFKLMITEKDRKLLKYRLSQRNDIVIKDSDQNKSSIG